MRRSPKAPLTPVAVAELFEKLDVATKGAAVQHGERRAARARGMTLLAVQLEVVGARRARRQETENRLHDAISAYHEAVEAERASEALLREVAALVTGGDEHAALERPQLVPRSMFTKGDDDGGGDF